MEPDGDKRSDGKRAAEPSGALPATKPPDPFATVVVPLSNALLTLAAQRISRALPGCAKRLRPGSGLEPGATLFPAERAINVFGPAILPAWVDWFGRQDEAVVRATVEQLATVSESAARESTRQVLAQAAPEATAEDREVALDYVSAIPAATREMLVPDPVTGKPSLQKTVLCAPNQIAHRILPSRVPPFPPNTELAGTPYVLEQILGCGGFGAVYKANNKFEQHAPPRALKFCLNPEVLPMLQRERDVLDRLMAAGRSSNWSSRIVTLYGHSLGTAVPFLVYEYVTGGALPAKLLATRKKVGRRLSPAEVLNIIQQITEGLAFAHGQGLVHRDIKPANVLVSKTGLKLADFGLGGVVSSHACATSQIGISEMTYLRADEQASLFRGSGTPLYMSPEQRRGDDPDPRHDIYSLGVMWYQLLLGDVTRQLHPGWREELLEESQAPGEHVDAIQLCVGYLKKRPRHGAELLALLSSLKAVKPAPAPGSPAARPAEPSRDGPPSAKESAKPSVVPAASEAPGRELARFHRHMQKVTGVAISRDGTLLATCSLDAAIRLCDLAGGSELKSLEGHRGGVLAVAITGDGQHVVSAGEDGTVRIWEARTGKCVRTDDCSREPIVSLALPAHGQWFATGTAEGQIAVWDFRTGKRLRQMAGQKGSVLGLGFSPDSLALVSGSDEALVRVWDVRKARETLRFDTPRFSCFALAWDGKSATTAGLDGVIHEWRLSDGERTRRYAADRSVVSVAVSPDGQRVLSGGIDSIVRLWDAAAGRELLRLAGHRNSVSCVAFSSDGRTAVSGSLDAAAILWSLPE